MWLNLNSIRILSHAPWSSAVLLRMYPSCLMKQITSKVSDLGTFLPRSQVKLLEVPTCLDSGEHFLLKNRPCSEQNALPYFPVHQPQEYWDWPSLWYRLASHSPGPSANISHSSALIPSSVMCDSHYWASSLWDRPKNSTRTRDKDCEHELSLCLPPGMASESWPSLQKKFPSISSPLILRFLSRGDSLCTTTSVWVHFSCWRAGGNRAGLAHPLPRPEPEQGQCLCVHTLLALPNCAVWAKWFESAIFQESMLWPRGPRGGGSKPFWDRKGNGCPRPPLVLKGTEVPSPQRPFAQTLMQLRDCLWMCHPWSQEQLFPHGHICPFWVWQRITGCMKGGHGSLWRKASKGLIRTSVL